MSDKKELVIAGYESPEEQKAMQNAVSMLRTMGMLAKFPDGDCEVFVRICLETGLNPILKEIYAVPYYNADLKREVLGTITDYHVFLDRAELSGQLDWWETEWEGEVVKKTITKTGTKRDGSKYNYTTEVIDKQKSTLSARIIIARKDKSRPHTSRWVRLIDEMKDTPFWHDDPAGMLEKNLIKEYFAKIFPKECGRLVDQSREVKVADYEVVSDTSSIKEAPAANQMEILAAAKLCDDLLNSFNMVGSEMSKYRDMVRAAISEKDITKLQHLAQTLQEKKDVAVAAHNTRKQEEPVDTPFTPVDTHDAQPVTLAEQPAAQEEAPKAESPAQAVTESEDIIAVLNELFSIEEYPISHKRNSIAKHLPSVFLSPESHDWESAIRNAAIPKTEGDEAIAYYKSCIPKAKKMKKDKDAKAKQGYREAAIAKIDTYPEGDVKNELMGKVNEAQNEAPDSDAWKLILDEANEYYEAVVNENK